MEDKEPKLHKEQNEGVVIVYLLPAAIFGCLLFGYLITAWLSR